MEGRFLFTPRLTVRQSRKLCAVAEQKFNLESGSVVRIDQDAIQREIGRKEDDIGLARIVLDIRNANVPLECFAIDHRGIDRDILVLIAAFVISQKRKLTTRQTDSVSSSHLHIYVGFSARENLIQVSRCAVG